MVIFKQETLCTFFVVFAFYVRTPNRDLRIQSEIKNNKLVDQTVELLLIDCLLKYYINNSNYLQGSP